MCGPQIKKYTIDSCPLNIKEATKDDATKDDARTTSEEFLYSGGLSFNPFASTDNNRAEELDDKTMTSNTHAINKDNFALKYYHVTDDLQGTLSPRSLHALENCSEKLSDSLLYTCDVAAKGNESKVITNSHKRSLEDDSSLPRIDLQSSSRPKRTTKKAKRNVYSPSSSSETENNIEKPKTKKRAGRKKKRKGAPSRPLSAYNFFFKQERMRLKNLSSSSDHPKIGFSSMGKIIGTNWKSMSEKAKAPYKVLADKDHERYARELEIFEEKERIAAGNTDSMLDIAPRISTSTSTDIFKPRKDSIEKEEAYHSSFTSSTNSSITQQEELQDDQEGVNNTLQEVLLEDIEPIPLNEVWKPNSNGYKTLQNEALYGFNFGDFKF